ncbi:MAG: U32 family peptidase [Nostoc sp.]|uniref:U32 family peptidase n=1 Tax=Nostoc sp. TaxID=1180 RepID=UPI002FF8E05F
MKSDISDGQSLRPSSPPSLQRPELLAPTGNWDCAKAAVENGADAIYFGLDRFNARMRAENFTEADLPSLMRFLHSRGVKGYVTVNTLIFPKELAEAQQYLRTIIAAGVDAVIVQDVGICRLIRHLSPDFPIHASTQMTITSATGVEFAKSLGCQLVVLARECSLQEINKIQQQIALEEASLPLELFVHGALCVAYSGQCLTSEALGGRSANRGECAQACRMPYDLIADGEVVNLKERKYLLSPQDLAGLDVLPDLVKSGVTCLKIEGRLKAPEYVANVTRVYRQALDGVMAELERPNPLTSFPMREGGIKAPLSETERGWGRGQLDREHYNLEMAFSRGLYTGWFGGINNQELVHARFGKKRGVYLGEVTRIHNEQVTVKLEAPVKPGDGIVFDCGHPEAKEEGGRVYAVVSKGKEAMLTFGRNDLNLRRVHIGDRIWKTSDPELDKQLRQSFAGENPQFQRPIDVEVYGEIGLALIAIARDRLGNIVQVESTIFLVEAHTKPLDTNRLQEQFGRLGNTPFMLGTLTNHLSTSLMLPISELNRMRREIVVQLEELRSQPKPWQLRSDVSFQDLLPSSSSSSPSSPSLIVLVRNLKQLQAALKAGVETLYCEFEDPRAYREAVQMVRQQQQKNKADNSSLLTDAINRVSTTNSCTDAINRVSQLPTIWVAPPRITKPGENWILQQVRACEADGYLIRNYDQLQFFAQDRCIGDFSLNVANPLTADYFQQRFGLERLTASYDLNITQLQDLLTSCPPQWFEVTIHQHIPMFHMEHCVFCAFLSTGTDYTNCGRPCEKQEVKLKDRVGSEHVIKADVGCRNTVFNGTAQTGAEYVQRLLELGLGHFRIEFVNETPEQVSKTIHCYRQLLQGKITGSQLWRELKLQNQLGVTRGPLAL